MSKPMNAIAKQKGAGDVNRVPDPPKSRPQDKAPQHYSPLVEGTMHGFSRLAGWSAEALGSATAFITATAACLLWAASGPFFDYSDTWQLVVNTATTVLTFLAVFLIQHSQNKEGKALQLKLDELIRATKDARNWLIDLEHCSEEELRELQEEFAKRKLKLDRSNQTGKPSRE
jgi:low affinity Fe/Cu permease